MALTKKQKGGAVAGVAALIAIIVALVRKAVAAPPAPGLATLWGIVTDASTGEPISGIEATLDSLLVITETNGRYEFANVEPGEYLLVFTDPLGRYETLVL